MTDSERIRKVVDYYDVSVNRFSKRLDINTPQILYDVLKGKNGLSKDLAEKITRKCNEINPGWLLTGEGEMLKQDDRKIKEGDESELREENHRLFIQLIEAKDALIRLKDELLKVREELYVMHNQEDKKKESNLDNMA